MTTVQLNDGPGKKPRIAKLHHTNNEPNGQAKDQPNKAHKNTESHQLPKVTEEIEKPPIEEDTTPRDYDTLPRLEGNLTAGDTIAYKVIPWFTFLTTLLFFICEELTDNLRSCQILRHSRWTPHTPLSFLTLR